MRPGGSPVDLLGLISALLGAAEVARDFSAWLRARADPCSKAVARTIADYPNLEGLRDRFKALLDLPRLEAMEQQLKDTGQVLDLDGLARLFVEECGFYWGEESRTQAQEVLRHFFEALNEEVLMSPEAHPVMDARSDSRTPELQFDIRRVEGKVDILTGYFPVPPGESHIPAIPSAPTYRQPPPRFPSIFLRKGSSSVARTRSPR